MRSAPKHCRYLPTCSYSLFPLSGPLGSLAVNPSSPCWWKWLGIKQRLYLTSSAWGPDGRLACSQGERWSLYLSVLYPIRVSPSITPYIQRMRTAFTKLCDPSRPLFTMLTASLSSLPTLTTPHSSTLQSHTHSVFSLMTTWPYSNLVPFFSSTKLLKNNLRHKTTSLIRFESDHSR